MKWIWLGVLGAVASGCAYETGYYERSYYPPPAETAPPVSTYSIPTNDPRGSVHVMSLGTEQLPVAAGQPSSYLHLRIAPENQRDDVAWSVDPNEQTLAVAGATVPPSFSETSTGTPVLTLAKGAHGYMDVYYPAPAAGTGVALAWRVKRGTVVASGSTPFNGVATTDQAYARYEAAPSSNVYVGVGLGWWWPSYSYYGWDPWWWGGGPWFGHYPRYYGGYYPRYGYYGGYGGHRYYGGYGGGGYYGGARGYSGGRVYSPSTGGWRGGGGGGGGAVHAAPSGGGGWRGGGRR